MRLVKILNHLPCSHERKVSKDLIFSLNEFHNFDENYFQPANWTTNKKGCWYNCTLTASMIII